MAQDFPELVRGSERLNHGATGEHGQGSGGLEESEDDAAEPIDE